MRKPNLKIWIIICITLFVFGMNACVVFVRQDRYKTQIVLKGAIVTPDEIIDPGWIVIEKGKIRKVLSQRPNIPGAIELNTGGIIFPGLIDLHNHISYNVFARWEPSRLFSNRYEWRENDEYRENVGSPYANLRSRYFCEMNTYGEVRALVGGTTSILATAPGNCIRGLVRNLDHNSGFYGLFERDSDHIKNSVNFPTSVNKIQGFLLDDRSEAFFIHLAEGLDASSLREFEDLTVQSLLSAKTVLIHGTALESNQFNMMSAKGASLIWSPRSNIELYGQTADILSALENDVAIALAPDWAITGSSNMLDELHYAAEWNSVHMEGRFSDQQLVELVTKNPAMIAGISEYVGTIREGLFADLLIIDGDSSQPYRALIESEAGNVQRVLIDGIPLYGSQSIMERFWESSEFTTIEIFGQKKAILLPDYTSTVNRLKDALLSEGIQLGPLVETRQ